MEIKKLVPFLLTFLAPMALHGAAGASVSEKIFDFNDGFQGWVPSEDQPHFEWIITSMDYVAGNHPELDGSFLFMNVPQEASYRTHAYITSPEILLGDDSSLSFYAGYNNKWTDDFCRLYLLVSNDNFVTSEVLWKSNYKMVNSWDWYQILVPLERFDGQRISFRLLYSTGYDPDMENRGGYRGDFAIDNFTVSSAFPDSPEPSPGNGDETDDDTEGSEDSSGITAVGTDDFIFLYDLSGRKVTDNADFNLSNLPKGIYILRTSRSTSKIIL